MPRHATPRGLRRSAPLRSRAGGGLRDPLAALCDGVAKYGPATGVCREGPLVFATGRGSRLRSGPRTPPPGEAASSPGEEAASSPGEAQLSRTRIPPLGAPRSPARTDPRRSRGNAGLPPEGHRQHPGAQESPGAGGGAGRLRTHRAPKRRGRGVAQGSAVFAPGPRSGLLSQNRPRLRISQCEFCTARVGSPSAARLPLPFLHWRNPSPRNAPRALSEGASPSVNNPLPYGNNHRAGTAVVLVKIMQIRRK